MSVVGPPAGEIVHQRMGRFHHGADVRRDRGLILLHHLMDALTRTQGNHRQPHEQCDEGQNTHANDNGEGEQYTTE